MTKLLQSFRDRIAWFRATGQLKEPPAWCSNCFNAMRLRFALRDVFWFTALMAMGFAWMADHQNTINKWSSVYGWADSRAAGIAKECDELKAKLAAADRKVRRLESQAARYQLPH
jgi:hypothetical protein